MKVQKWGARLPAGVDPYQLPDQRYVHTADDGSVTVEYPSAFQPPALNDLVMQAFGPAVDAIVESMTKADHDDLG